MTPSRAARRFGLSRVATEAFFDANVEQVSRACHALAGRFDAGGRLLVVGEGTAASDAHHVAVEFVHPVLVGKRALPARAITTPAGTGSEGWAARLRPWLRRDGSPMLDGCADAARLSVGREDRVAFTTDSYVVSPLVFPGGDIGKLAVNGTLNDLACAGAQPLYLSLGFILEEGLAVETLKRVLQSIAAAAVAAGVQVVTGDTKVVPRGHGDGLYVNTSGVDLIAADVNLSAANVRAGDIVIVSGHVGDHGMAVMLAREALEIDAEIVSDSAALHTLAAAILQAAPATRVLKDPTRGGVASALNEIASPGGGVAIALEEDHVPVRTAVRGVCEILGIDPLHVANEGCLVAIVPPDEASAALAAMRAHPRGGDAAIIGNVLAQPEGMVIARTAVGGSRVIDMLVGDPLPRIC